MSEILHYNDVHYWQLPITGMPFLYEFWVVKREECEELLIMVLVKRSLS